MFMTPSAGGFTVRVAAKLNPNTVLKYLEQVSVLLNNTVQDKRIGNGILENLLTPKLFRIVGSNIMLKADFRSQ